MENYYDVALDPHHYHHHHNNHDQYDHHQPATGDQLDTSYDGQQQGRSGTHIDCRWEKVKVLGVTTLSSALEWQDFVLFGTLSGMVFRKHFFGDDKDPVGIYNWNHAAYAIGFLTRPLGAMCFGHIGDRVGRKRVVTTTVSVLGIASMGIGFVPTYQNIGILSPMLLVLLRGMQGLALGGQWGSSVLMAYEYGNRAEQGLFASIPQIGQALGMAISLAIVTTFTHFPGPAFEDYGWRIPFLLSGLLVPLAYYIHVSIRETPQFQRVQQEADTAIIPVPLFQALGQYPRNILCGLGALWMDGLMFNVLAVWCVSYLTKDLALPYAHVLGALAVAAVISCFIIPATGALTDLIGRKKVYITGCLLCGVTWFYAFNAYTTAATSSPPKLWLLYLTTITPFSFFYPLMLGSFPSLLADVFATNVRHTSISLVYQVSRVYASGLAPMICRRLFAIDHTTEPISGYILAVSVVSALCAGLLKREDTEQLSCRSSIPEEEKQSDVELLATTRVPWRAFFELVTPRSSPRAHDTATATGSINATTTSLVHPLV